MVERPILFNSYAVRAILDGTKTQTRRVIRPQPTPYAPPKLGFNEGYDLVWKGCGYALPVLAMHSCYGVPGDYLWVRETARGRCYGTCGNHRPVWIELLYHADEEMVQFERDSFGPYQLTGRWTPSIHMPRWASRIILEVTDVCVERVQEITLADAVAEGFPSIESNDPMPPIDRIMEPFEWFHQLWDSIYAKRGYGWSTNPWVWVIEFRRI